MFDFTGFDLLEKVEPVSVVLIDIDSGSPRPTRVILTDVLGGTRTYLVPAGWTEDVTRDPGPGLRSLDLTSLLPQPGFLATATASEGSRYIASEIVRLEVELGGSGAVDKLVFRREADPAPAESVTPVRARNVRGR